MLQPRSYLWLKRVSNLYTRKLTFQIVKTKSGERVDLPTSQSLFCSKFNKHGYAVSATSSTEYLLRLADRLLEKLSSNERNVGEKSSLSIKNDLSAILYQLYKREKEDLLLSYFEDMIQKNVANEASCRIMMRYYMDQLNVEKCQYVFDILKRNENVRIRSRSYVPLIELYLRCADFEQCALLLKEMVTVMGVHFDYSSFHVLLERCIDLRTLENYDNITYFVEQIFNVIQDFGHNLNIRLVKLICNWFHTDPKNNWNVVKTKLHKDEYICDKCDFCNHCKNAIKKWTISSERLQNLEENLLLLIKAGLLQGGNKNKRNYEELYHRYIYNITNEKGNLLHSIVDEKSSDGKILVTLAFLRKHIKENGPFDIIIDGVNTSYLTNLREIVDSFLQENMKVLVLCAGVLRKELLILENLSPADVELKKLLLHLQQWCSLFFIDSATSNDDYYLLYSLLLHDFNTQLVSSDFFRDHLAFLDVECRVDFLHWQKSNQYFINNKKKSGSSPLLVRNDFHVGMQKCGEGWHIPLCTGAKWYCISKCS